MTYRNRALLNLAHKLNTCPLCGKYSMDGLEPAHSDSSRHGKGMGHKASDVFHAAICHDCHTLLPNLDRNTRELTWSRAFEATMLAYFENGWITLKGK